MLVHSVPTKQTNNVRSVLKNTSTLPTRKTQVSTSWMRRQFDFLAVISWARTVLRVGLPMLIPAHLVGRKSLSGKTPTATTRRRETIAATTKSTLCWWKQGCYVSFAEQTPISRPIPQRKHWAPGESGWWRSRPGITKMYIPKYLSVALAKACSIGWKILCCWYTVSERKLRRTESTHRVLKLQIWNREIIFDSLLLAIIVHI